MQAVGAREMSYRFSKVGSRDANHEEVARWYEDLYCSVVDVSTVPGYVDLNIGCSGLTEIVEVKTDDGELSISNKAFAKTWRGSKIVIARTQNDVLEHVQRMRAKQSYIRGNE